MVSVKHVSILFLLILSFHHIVAQTIDKKIDSLIHQITVVSYRSHFDSLQTNIGCSRSLFNTKLPTKDHDECRDYILRNFQNYLGINNVYLHKFDFENLDGLSNIIGYKEGKSPWKGIIVISAHYDTSNGREDGYSDSDDSPGANDNGTGLAAMLEILRVLSSVETEMSILFTAWDSEEIIYEGYSAGSNIWYNNKIRNKRNTEWLSIGRGGLINSGDIFANINFDMFGNPQDSIDGKPLLWACSGHVIHEKFVNDYVETFDKYIPEIKVINQGKMIYSDHYIFANRRIPAVENLESDYDTDPFYHTSYDNIENEENVNLDFSVNVTRGGFAFILEKAGIYNPRFITRDIENDEVILSKGEECYNLKTSFPESMVEVYDHSGKKVKIQKEKGEYYIYPDKSGYYFVYITDFYRYTDKKIYLLK